MGLKRVFCKRRN